MLVPPATFGARGTSLINTLGNLGQTSSLQLGLDAGDLNSYDGSSQTFKDLSGNANNLALGNSTGDATNDPVFNGTAGRQSSSEYFAVNGSSQRLTMISVPAWVHTLHKDNAIFTWAAWRKNTLHDSAVGETFLQTVGSGTPGITFGVGNTANGNDGKLSFGQWRTSSDATTIASGPTVGSAAWVFLAVSYTESTGAWLMQVNGTQQTGTQAYVSPSASNASGLLLANIGTNGGNIHTDAIWTRALSSTELLALYNATKGKFGL